MSGAATGPNFTNRDQFPAESSRGKTGQKFHELWHSLKTKGKAQSGLQVVVVEDNEILEFIEATPSGLDRWWESGR
jgi:hypothetical protein